VAAALPPSPGIVHSARGVVLSATSISLAVFLLFLPLTHYTTVLWNWFTAGCGYCCVLGTGFRLLCLLRAVRGGKAFPDCGHGYLHSLGEVPVLFERLNSQLRIDLALWFVSLVALSRFTVLGAQLIRHCNFKYWCRVSSTLHVLHISAKGMMIRRRLYYIITTYYSLSDWTNLHGKSLMFSLADYMCCCVIHMVCCNKSWRPWHFQFNKGFEVR